MHEGMKVEGFPNYSTAYPHLCPFIPPHHQTFQPSHLLTFYILSMPIWLIETFGSGDLDQTFLLILLMTAPVWVAMIAFPETRIVRVLAQPFLLPPLYCVVLFILLWKSHQSAVLPDPYAPITYESARQFSRHPISFLALFCNLQILNLIVGTMIYQKSVRSGMRAPIELLICWFVGAIAAIPFALRLLVRKKSLT